MPTLFTTPVPDRPLVAYAFLAQTSYTDGDLLSALAPIFKPIAKAKEGMVFDANDFAKDVAKVFGLEVHPWAIEELAPRLERAGLLTKVSASALTHQYIYAPVTQSFSDVTESDIGVVVSKFIAFAEPILAKHSIPIERKALEEGFLDQLIRMDFMSILIKPDRTKDDHKGDGILSLPKSPERIEWENQLSAKAKIDVLSASFILHLYRDDRPLYDLLVRITSGALLAEVILNVQDPGTTAKLDRLTVILDAPFLMSILDLATEESHEYAKRVLDSLVEHGASIATFRHYTEEIKLNLQAVIQETAAGRGFRATARRLHSPAFQQYAAVVTHDVPQALSALNIRIIDPPSSTASYQYFSEEYEDQFSSSLGTYTNKHAQRRDAATIAGIMRLRSNKRIRMTKFSLADYIFVTDNGFLARQAGVFLKSRNMYDEGEIPAVLTDRYLAGLLWIIYGGKAQELSRYRLLANCTAALDLRSDVVNRTYRFLAETDTQKADRFRALMTTERASQHLMQLTLGDSVLISKDNAIALLDDIETGYSDKYRKEAEAEISKALQEKSVELNALEISKNADYEQLKTVNEQLKTQVIEAATQVLSITQTVKQLEQHTAGLQEERDAETSCRISKERKFIDKCARSALRAEKAAQIVLAIALGLLTGVISYISLKYADKAAASAFGISLVLAVACAFGFWRIPDFLFGKLFTRFRDSYFRRKLRSGDAEDYIDHYAVEWKLGKATRKS